MQEREESAVRRYDGGWTRVFLEVMEKRYVTRDLEKISLDYLVDCCVHLNLSPRDLMIDEACLL